MLKYFTVCLLLISQFSSICANDRAKMLQDLDVIKSVFEAKYAPYEWKRDYIGWDLNTEMIIAKSKVLSYNTLSVKDYQKILHSFFISLCDYHVAVKYYSTEVSLLPFDIKGIDGRYYFTYVDKSFLREMEYYGSYVGDELCSTGNEIVLFDGQPVQEVLDELKVRELGNPSSYTAEALAQPLLTTRVGRLGHQIPQGPIQIVFINDEGEYIEAEIEWLHIPERINNHAYYTAMATFGKRASASIPDSPKAPKAPKLKKDAEKLMISPVAEALKKDYLTDYKKVFYKKNKPADLNEEQEKRPWPRESVTFGKKIWEESPKSDFKGHIYQLPGTNKRIGFIRIDTYFPSDDLDSINLSAIRLAKTLRYFETHTDALLIDQMDNPGGYFYYAAAILSMLTDRPLTLPKDRVAITQEDVAEALDILDEIEETQLLELAPDDLSQFDSEEYILGFPRNRDYFLAQQSLAQNTVEQWNLGKTLTDGFPISGIQALKPHPLASYSKPILVLVNEKDFSCGDFFPAILQDNRRALIFGTRTAGAGGAVRTLNYPNSFGIEGFSYTYTIAERPDGSPIENLGVTPDIWYSLTESDLMYGYEGYIRAINSTLKQMVGP